MEERWISTPGMLLSLRLAGATAGLGVVVLLLALPAFLFYGYAFGIVFGVASLGQLTWLAYIALRVEPALANADGIRVGRTRIGWMDVREIRVYGFNAFIFRVTSTTGRAYSTWSRHEASLSQVENMADLWRPYCHGQIVVRTYWKGFGILARPQPITRGE